MPFADKERKLAYQREWYRKNREKVIAQVANRKKTLYKGICRNCGGPTMGNSKNAIPEWCGKPECRSAQFKLRANDFADYRLGASRAIEEYKKGGELFLVDSFRQRDALRKDLSKEKLAVERTLDNVRTVEPFDVGLDREDYDAVLMQVRIAKAALDKALDTIDEATNRKE